MCIRDRPYSSAPRTVEHLTPLTVAGFVPGSTEGKRENENYLVKLKYGSSETLPRPRKPNSVGTKKAQSWLRETRQGKIKEWDSTEAK